MSPDGVDLEALSALVRERLPGGTSETSRLRARRLLDDGVLSTPGFGDHDCAPASWERLWADTADRRRARYVHGFLFLPDLPGHLVGSRGPGARRLFDVLRRWDQLYPRDTGHPMAYHDETTAQRLIGTMAVLPHLEALGPGPAAWVHDFLDRTGDLLAEESFHAGDNNHGMFQDIALLTYAALARWRSESVRRAHLGTADERLMRYFRESFTAEGVHIENAPNYHILVARHLKQHHDLATAVGLPHAAELARTLARAVSYATHAVTPAGDYPLVSDTQPTAIAPVARDVFADPAFVFAATGGVEGTEPADRVLVLPESGYAIYRSAWGDPDATYLYFACAYNSGYHKHSDENSLWLRSGGNDLLVESGPNGYSYADPLTRYAYSQQAHNTVVVDDRSTPRADGRHDAVSLTADEVRPDGWRVTGRNARLDGAVHHRTVEVTERAGSTTVAVTDRVSSSSAHRYDLLWHVGQGLVVERDDHGFALVRDGRRRLRLTYATSSPVEQTLHLGEGGDRPQGWRFPRFGQPVPSPVVRLRVTGTDVVVTTTIEVLDDAVAAQHREPVQSRTMPAVTPHVHGSRSSGEPDDATSDAADDAAPRVTAQLGEGASISASMQMPGATQYAFKLYRGSLLVAEVGYSGRSEASWAALSPGRYRVRGYARAASGEPSSARTTESIYVR